MIFEQIGNQFIHECDIRANGRKQTGRWVIRPTHSMKMWVVEYVSPGTNFMLPAQRVYESPESAAQVAADGSRLGVIHNSGKWQPDRSRGPVQPQRYELFRIPESVINWA